ncbi:MAG: class I SAM-dependent methyltransferase [Nitrososphaerota archaeon]|nr:class I SAM-dependent methyltransferase [Nitrososphaerota archaeon]
MGVASDVAVRFDRIASSYDETRERLTDEAVEKVATLLRRDGAVSILEAGVGTGRIALPLQRRRFEVTGLDLSAGMLAKAKAKGMARLVMADAASPPFRRKSFDAAVLAHVLQLLENPTRTFQSLSEVAKKEIDVFLRKPNAHHDRANEAREQFYLAFGAATKELGVPFGERYYAWRGRYAK